MVIPTMIAPDTNYNLKYGNNVYTFNYCCGTAELGTFNLDEVQSGSTPKTVEEYKAELVEVMQRKAVSSIIATTVYLSENYHWNQINLHLEAIGWKRLTSYINKNSDNTVIIWHYSRD